MFTRRSRIQGANLTSISAGKKRTDKKNLNSTLEKLENRLLLSTSYQLLPNPASSIPADGALTPQGTQLTVVPNSATNFANDIFGATNMTASGGEITVTPYNSTTKAYGTTDVLYTFVANGTFGPNVGNVDNLVVDKAGDLWFVTQNGGNSGGANTLWEIPEAEIATTITTPATPAPPTGFETGTDTGVSGITSNVDFSSLATDSSGDLFFNTAQAGYAQNGSGGVWELKNNGTVAAPTFTANSAELVYAIDGGYNFGQVAYAMAFDPNSGALYVEAKAGGYSNYWRSNGEVGWIESVSQSALQTAYATSTPLLASTSHIVATIDPAYTTVGSSPDVGRAGISADTSDFVLSVDSNGNLWGMSGIYGQQGMLWEVTPAEQTIENTTYSGTGVAISSQPLATLIASNFGGNLLEVAPVAIFGSGANAAYNDQMGYQRGENFWFDSSGDLFGVTAQGGTNSVGVVFEIKSGSASLTTIVSLPNTTTDGTLPDSNIVGDSFGNLYIATSAGGANSSGAIVEITDAAKLAYTSGLAATGGGVVGGFGTAMQVSVEDEYNNVVTTDATVVTLTINSYTGPLSGSIGGTITATAINGIATFSNVQFLNPGSYTLGAIDSTDLIGTPGVALTGTGQSVTVDDAPVFSSEPTNTTAGATFTPIVITYENNDGSTATAWALGDTITLSISGTANTFSGGSTTAVVGAAGTATFTGLDETTAGTYALTAKDEATNQFASSSSFVISPAASNHLVVAAQITSTSSGVPVGSPGVVIEIEDQYNNIATGDSSAISLAVFSQTPASPAVTFAGGSITTVNATNGVASFESMTLNAGGLFTATLQATDGALTPANTGPITIAGFVYEYQNLPLATDPAGLLPTLTIDIDNSANVLQTLDNTSTMTLTLTSSPGSLTGTLTAQAVNGVVNFNNLHVNAIGTYTFSVSNAPDGVTNYSGSVGNPATFVVAPGLAFESQSTSAFAGGGTAGNLLEFQVDVVDGNNVTVPSDSTSTVTLAINSGTFGDGNTTETAVVTGGVATFTTLFITADGTYTFTATDTADGITGSPVSAPLVVTAQSGTTSQLLFSNISNGTAGAALPSFTVSDLDPYGNVVTADTSVITLSVESGPGNISGTVTAQSVNGVATFNGVVGTVTGDYLLQAADSTDSLSQQVDTTNDFTISAGAPSQFVIVGLTSGSLPNATAGANIAVTVDVEDGFGNLVPTATVPVTIGLLSGTFTSGTLVQTSVNGVALFNDLVIDTAGSYTFTFPAGTSTAYSFNFGVGNAWQTSYYNATPLVSDSLGNIFGVASTKPGNGGQLFEIPNGSTTPVILYNLNGGYQPQGSMFVDSHDNIWYLDKGGGGGVWEAKNNGVGTWAAPVQMATLGGSQFNDFNTANAIIVDGAGNLFGIDVSRPNGTGENGGIWEFVNTGTLALPAYGTPVLVASNTSTTPGQQPSGNMAIDSNGDIFGTSRYGTPGGQGSVWELQNTGTVAAPAYAAMTNLAQLNYGVNGQNSRGVWLDPFNGALFDVANNGGSGNGGINEIPATGGSYGAMVNLVRFSVGTNPYGLTFDSAGDVFYASGVTNAVYELAYNALTQTYSAPITLETFTNGPTGGDPIGLAFSGNTLVGVSTLGGANGDGTIFDILPGQTANVKVVAARASKVVVLNQPANTSVGANDTVVVAVEDAFNNIVTTSTANIALSLNAGTNLFNSVAVFNSPGSGYASSMISDTSGDVFGISSITTGNGTASIFEITKAGVYKTLVNLNTSYNGAMPQGPLFLDSSNNLWFITKDAGGGVYEIKSTGAGVWASTATLVATMNNAGFSSYNDVSGGVIVDGFGNIFGVDTFASNGNIFEWKNHGTIAGPIYTTPVLVHDFTFGADGGQPDGNLAIDSKGDIFGTTKYGPGSSNVWELKNTGTLTSPNYGFITLDQIPYDDGQPGNGLWIDPNGDLLISESGPGGATTELDTFTLVGAPTSGEVFSITEGAQTVSYTAGAAPTAASVITGLVTAWNGNATVSATATAFANTNAVVITARAVNTALSLTHNANLNLAVSHAVVNGAISSALPNMAQGVLPKIYVGLEDQYGNICTASSESSIVTMSIFTGPADSSIGGTKILAASAGVATFSNLILNTQGQYVLRATALGKTGNSTAFSVQTNVPAKLAFLTQPNSSDVVGAVVGTVDVAVENSFGDIIVSGPNSLSTVTMALSAFGPLTPTGATLGGTTMVKAVNGVATFTTLSVSKYGTYQLKATDGAIATHPTATSTLIHAGDAVFFSLLPTSTNGVVAIALQNSSAVTQIDNSIVTLSYGTLGNTNTTPELKSNGATSLTAQAVNGIATFNVSILTTNQFGTAAGLPDSGTFSFKVTGADVAPGQNSASVKLNQLQITNSATSPSTLLPTSGTSPNNVVTVFVGAYVGNRQAGDNTDTVTLAINSQSGVVGGPATLTGTTTAVVVNGVAHFTVAEQVLGADAPGTYSFIATGSNAAGVQVFSTADQNAIKTVVIS